MAPARPELAGLVNWGGGAELPVHRWFRYREGFSPELIGALGLGRRILDPFCGAGSILVGAALRDRAAMGIDVNPLATFVARVKLSALGDRDIAAAHRFLAGCRSAVATAEPWPVPALRIATKVFEPAVLDTLLRMRTLIEERSATKGQRRFLLLAWVAILEAVGSYFKEGNGIKYRNRRRRPGGYVARPDGAWQRKRFGDDQAAFVVAAFTAQLAMMLDDVGLWRQGGWDGQRVMDGSALDELPALEPASFDDIVFSPPYANRFDYCESQKVELWFGGFVDGYEDLAGLRKRTLRSHLGAALNRPAPGVPPELEALIALIDPASYAGRARVPALLRGYCSDLATVLAQCRRLLVPGGRCFVVVGNSAYGGVIVPVDSLVARLGLEAGFAEAAVVPVRHLTVAPQQRRALAGRERWMRESVVVLA